MTPKVSVVVPVYNVENYLEKCLDSILEQTLEEIEIICVNDGSTDSSLDILRCYEKRDKRISIIDQKNQGLGAARNAGIAKAKGEYVGFVDSDDFIRPTMFEKLYKKAKRFDSDVVLTNIELYFTDCGTTQLFRDNSFYQMMSDTNYFTVMQLPKVLQSIGVWDRIYRRTFLEEYHLQNPVSRIYEDVLFTVQTSVYARRISVVNEPLYYYRKNTGHSIVDNEIKNDSYKFDFLKNLRESRDFLLACGKWVDLRKEFLAFQYSGMMYHQYNAQSRRSFLAFMRELSDILSADDIEIIAGMVTDKSGLLYLQLLKSHCFGITYLLYKVHKLYRSDDLYLYLRFPHTKKFWRVRKPGYRWKCEMRARNELTWEIRQIRIALEKVIAEQEPRSGNKDV